MRWKSSCSLIVLAGLLIAVPTVQAGEVSAELRVSATVVARTIAEVQTAPVSLEITPDDVRRGWAEAQHPSRVRIRTNDRNGYRLAFHVSGVPVRAIEVGGLGHDSAVGIHHGEGWVTRPYPGQVDTTVELTIRFVLDADAVPGVYTWPVSIQASPI